MNEKGQSLIEALIVLPVALLLVAGVGQGLWLLLVQQVLQAATVQVVRTGALSGMDMPTMHTVLLRRMKPVSGQRLYLPRIERLSPSDEVVRSYGERVETGQQSFYELRSDFAGVRMEDATADEKEQWLRHRIGFIRVTWCEPLMVPLAAQVIYNAVRRSEYAAQRYCNLQSVGVPLLAIEATAGAQLVAPLRIAG